MRKKTRRRTDGFLWEIRPANGFTGVWITDAASGDKPICKGEDGSVNTWDGLDV